MADVGIGDETGSVCEEYEEQGGRQGEAKPGREASPIARSKQAQRKADLARCRTGQKLAKADEIGIGAFAEPLTLRYELRAKVTQVGDRTAEAGEAQDREYPENFERASLFLCRFRYGRGIVHALDRISRRADLHKTTIY